MEQLKEIVEENDESLPISRSHDQEDHTIAVRQISIDSFQHLSVSNQLHKATSLELTMTMVSSPLPTHRHRTASSENLGLDLDDGSSPIPRAPSLSLSSPRALHHQNTTSLAEKINREFFPVDRQQLDQEKLDEEQEREQENDDDETNKQLTKVELKIGPQHFELLKLLGEGAFGKVILVQSRLNKEFFAMKVISKKLLKKKNNVSYMKSERDILTKINHPFLVPLCFAFQSQTKLFLVMRFLPGGELFLHLRKRGIIQEKEVQFYLGEMIIAIDFLHGKGIIHRDLKPENVLLRKDGHVCITDFGLAKEIGNIGSSTTTTARTLCGTSEYMAPEMLTRNGYGKAVDWWALGALCYEMMVGKPPFQGKTQKELDRKILSEKLSTPPYLSSSAHSLLRGMLDKDMNKRLGCAKSTMFSIGGITALKQHEFFAGLNWIALGNLQITPPIDLKKTDYSGQLPNKNNNKDNNKKVQPQQQPERVAVNNNNLPSTETEKNRKLSEEQEQEQEQERRLSDEKNESASDFPAVHVTSQPGNNDGESFIDPENSKTTDSEDFVSSLKYFDSEFTRQVLSRSLVEDTLTPVTTGCHTPVLLKGGGGTDSPLVADEEQQTGEDPFKNFEYIDESLTYSQQQIDEFESLFKAKQQKAAKKKQFQMKKEEKQLQEDEKKRKEQEELQKKLKQEQLERQKQLEVENFLRDKEKTLKQLAAERLTLLSENEKSQELLSAHQKKGKGIKKKLRDIQELKERRDQKKLVLDKDQLQKLSKENELLKELSEASQEEETANELIENQLKKWKEFEGKEQKIILSLENNPLNNSNKKKKSSAVLLEDKQPEGENIVGLKEEKKNDSHAAPAQQLLPLKTGVATTAPPLPLPPVVANEKKPWSSLVGGGAGNPPTAEIITAGSSFVEKQPQQTSIAPTVEEKKEKTSIPVQKEKEKEKDSWETVPVTGKTKNNSQRTNNDSNSKKPEPKKVGGGKK
jgi:serine/threonine protein kinase